MEFSILHQLWLRNSIGSNHVNSSSQRYEYVSRRIASIIELDFDFIGAHALVACGAEDVDH